MSEDLIAVDKHLVGRCRADRLFSEVHGEQQKAADKSCYVGKTLTRNEAEAFILARLKIGTGSPERR